MWLPPFRSRPSRTFLFQFADSSFPDLGSPVTPNTHAATTRVMKSHFQRRLLGTSASSHPVDLCSLQERLEYSRDHCAPAVATLTSRSSRSASNQSSSAEFSGQPLSIQ